jgi:plastocyanin
MGAGDRRKGRLRSRGSALLVGAALVGVMGGFVPSQAAKLQGQIIAGPGNATYPFLTARVVIQKGSTVIFRNLDTVQHNVDFPKKGVSTPNIGLLGTFKIAQVSTWKKGKYNFVCDLHQLMTGQLVIV